MYRHVHANISGYMGIYHLHQNLNPISVCLSIHIHRCIYLVDDVVVDVFEKKTPHPQLTQNHYPVFNRRRLRKPNFTALEEAQEHPYSTTTSTQFQDTTIQARLLYLANL